MEAQIAKLGSATTLKFNCVGSNACRLSAYSQIGTLSHFLKDGISKVVIECVILMTSLISIQNFHMIVLDQVVPDLSKYINQMRLVKVKPQTRLEESSQVRLTQHWRVFLVILPISLRRPLNLAKSAGSLVFL